MSQQILVYEFGELFPKITCTVQLCNQMCRAGPGKVGGLKYWLAWQGLVRPIFQDLQDIFNAKFAYQIVGDIELINWCLHQKVNLISTRSIYNRRRVRGLKILRIGPKGLCGARRAPVAAP